MQKHEIRTPKTARVFTLGNVESSTVIWIVLHGYAQLASDFLNDFKSLVNPQTAVIAPEALHRFYRRGFYGDVVSSWMTKDDRESDIRDYLEYLNTVYAQFIKPHQTVHVLGFSQGVATACRWIAEGTPTPKNLILWAGTFPTDIDLQLGTSRIRDIKTYMTFDHNDVFRTEESWQKQLDFFDQNQLHPILFEYEGGHKVPKNELLRFVETYINPTLA